MLNDCAKCHIKHCCRLLSVWVENSVKQFLIKGNMLSTRNGLSMLTRPTVALLSRIREHELWRESPYCLNWQPVEFRPIRLLELFCLWRNAKWCQLTCQKQRHTSAKWQMDHQKPISMLFLNGYGQFQQTRYVLKEQNEYENY